MLWTSISLNIIFLVLLFTTGIELKKCPNLYSTRSLQVTCSYNNTVKKNCYDAVPNTWARFRCANFYEDKAEIDISRCQEDGTWNPARPTCFPRCGISSPKATQLTLNGQTSSKGEYPWIAVLYSAEDKSLRCGATLISPNVVITAAHCVKDQYRTVSEENFTVAAGKYYSKYDDLRDVSTAQFRALQKIIVPNEYNGDYNNFYADLAILVTTSPFLLTHVIQPACIDFTGANRSESSRKTIIGYVFGWGTSTGISDDRKEVQLPIVAREVCLQNLQEEYIQLITADKICAGFFSQGSSLCKGDSGAGFLTKHENRYYLTGVVSVGPRSSEATCFSQNIAGFTRIGSYLNLIKEAELKYNIDETEHLTSNQICPDLLSTTTLKVTCKYVNETTTNCTGARHGATVHFKCAHFYELVGEESAVCQESVWSEMVPLCVPVCGEKTGKATPLVIDGINVTQGNYPWQVALYRLNDKELICGGSLITQRLVISAAHCVTHPDTGRLKEKHLFRLAVGKYYRKINDPRDNSSAQFSSVEKILIPRQYEGYLQNFFGDIAILISAKSFVLSQRVQPICLDYNLKYDTEFFNPRETKFGYVTGWGYTLEYGKPSEVLKEVKVPHVQYRNCKSGLPEDSKSYLTYDKICAGYFNQSTAVCLGDSGGGLVFKHKGRYYLTGVVSISPRALTEDGGCNSDQVGLYTKVTDYINFINTTLAIE